MPPDPQTGEATVPLTRPHPLGASRLHASLGAFGPSIFPGG